MLRPSQGSILTSSRAAQRRTARAERAKAAGSVFKTTFAVLFALGAEAVGLVLLVGLPIAYAVAAYFTLALPLRVLFGDASFSLLGTGVWLVSAVISAAGILRAVAGSEPIAPVRPMFGRVLLGLNWAAALVLAIADLSR